MLTLLGFGMVTAFMYLIMSRRLLPVVALIAVPIVFALLGGFRGPELGTMMLEGLRMLAPTGIMLMFAILYFGLMIDTGLFDPVVRCVLRAVKGDPLRLIVGTALLALFVSLDGDGSTTYMITVAAMLPLYLRLRINPVGLTAVTMLASGVMNLTPWGGPLARAAAALHVDAADVFVPMLPVMAGGIVCVMLIAWYVGRRERERVGVLRWESTPVSDCKEPPAVSEVSGERRPKLFWVNALLTIALMVGLIAGLLPLPVLFMIGFSIALAVNYPNLTEQRARLAAHAGNALAVVSVIFAAGIFTGILTGTGMVKAMSGSLLTLLPPALGPYLATITALASMPFTFFMSNDAFYFGVLPIVTQAAQEYGITPAEMARAALIGQPVHLLSPLVPSTYLLVGLAGVDFGDHQRFTLKWAGLVCVLMLAFGLVFGAFPLARHDAHAASAAPQVILTLPPGKATSAALPADTARWRKDGLVRNVLRLEATGEKEPGFSVLLILDMADEAAAARWEKNERPRLPAEARVRRVDACVHAERPDLNMKQALFEVNVYRLKTTSVRYEEFCSGYIAPLMEGQAEAGLMPWYTMYLERGAAGESNAVLVKAYRDADTYHQKAAKFKLTLREQLTAHHPTYPRLHAIKDTLRDNVSETLAVSAD